MAFEETVRQLREGKAALRRKRRNWSLEEKLIDLWRAQHAYVQIVGMRRKLRPWERPWNIRSDVRDTIVIKDGKIESFSLPISGSLSRSVRSAARWVLPASR